MHHLILLILWSCKKSIDCRMISLIDGLSKERVTEAEHLLQRKERVTNIFMCIQHFVVCYHCLDMLESGLHLLKIIFFITGCTLINRLVLLGLPSYHLTLAILAKNVLVLCLYHCLDLAQFAKAIEEIILP